MIKGGENLPGKPIILRTVGQKIIARKACMSQVTDQNQTINSKKGDYKKAYAIKRSTIRKEVKKVLKRRDDGYGSSDSSDSE